MIETTRLRLLPATVEMLAAELEGTQRLAEAAGLHVAPGWPPQFYDSSAIEFTLRRLVAVPDESGWWMYYMVDREQSKIIGACGFKGPPSADGTVELGYAVVAEYQRRGYASEAVAGMVAHCFELPHVTRVIAETLPELVASIGVLVKGGFAFIGEGSETGVIRYELSRASRSEEVPVVVD
jgi:[ribosomal protein S5]-alanine N-acetyltransferase